MRKNKTKQNKSEEVRKEAEPETDGHEGGGGGYGLVLYSG